MNRRQFLSSAAAAAQNPNASRPNVLLIMTDQHRMDAIKSADWMIDLGQEGGAAGW